MNTNEEIGDETRHTWGEVVTTVLVWLLFMCLYPWWGLKKLFSISPKKLAEVRELQARERRIKAKLAILTRWESGEIDRDQAKAELALIEEGN